MQLYNIHSHSSASDPNEWVLQNLDSLSEEAVTTGFYAAGVHPWHLKEETAAQQLNQLKHISKKENVLAIGECGLDKICTTPFSLQQTYFIEQIRWANTIHKPLIIHCVRAFGEIRQLLIEHRNQVPVIFHGFNKIQSLATQLIKEGYWLSFGKALSFQNVQEVFANIPVENIFLETDDSQLSIEAQYALAASIKNISIELLSTQIQQNIQQVFKQIY